jgi:DnaJ-class molecular chaperone
MACECVTCPSCGGSGNYYVDRNGSFVGQHRSDDLQELETCDECRGSGLTETCGECLEAEELEGV